MALLDGRQLASLHQTQASIGASPSFGRALGIQLNDGAVDLSRRGLHRAPRCRLAALLRQPARLWGQRRPASAPRPASPRPGAAVACSSAGPGRRGRGGRRYARERSSPPGSPAGFVSAGLVAGADGAHDGQWPTPVMLKPILRNARLDALATDAMSSTTSW